MQAAIVKAKELKIKFEAFKSQVQTRKAELAAAPEVVPSADTLPNKPSLFDKLRQWMDKAITFAKALTGSSASRPVVTRTHTVKYFGDSRSSKPPRRRENPQLNSMQKLLLIIALLLAHLLLPLWPKWLAKL